jgi:hypothetical protein
MAGESDKLKANYSFICVETNFDALKSLRNLLNVNNSA